MVDSLNQSDSKQVSQPSIAGGDSLLPKMSSSQANTNSVEQDASISPETTEVANKDSVVDKSDSEKESTQIKPAPQDSKMSTVSNVDNVPENRSEAEDAKPPEVTTAKPEPGSQTTEKDNKDVVEKSSTVTHIQTETGQDDEESTPKETQNNAQTLETLGENKDEKGSLETDVGSHEMEVKEEVNKAEQGSSHTIDTSHPNDSEALVGNHVEEGDSEGTSVREDQTITQDNECGKSNNTEDAEVEQDDILGNLPSQSAMLVPIPEPDYTYLADKEKLFPRPAISNPKVCYELCCKQLKVVPISQYFRSLENYTEDLRLQSYGLGREDMMSLCHSLAYNTTATSLNISNNRLDDSMLPSIQAMMNDNSFIGSIDLSRNMLGGPGLGSLRVMLTNNYTLTSLDLSRCQLLDADAPALAAVIEVSLNLRRLNLSHNELSESGKVFATVLAVDEGLEVLDLSWNVLRSRSGRDLLMGMCTNSQLKRLDLSWNSLGPDVVRGVRALLKRNTTLVELDLSHNQMRDANMKPIALGLISNKTLEKIWLGYNPVSPIGALAMVKALAKATVGYVDMSNIEVSSDFEKFKNQLDPSVIKIVHGTINVDMVLIVPNQKKGKGPPAPVAKKKK